MQKIAVLFAIWLLKRDINIKYRALILNTLLDKLAMLPLRSIISVNDNGSLVIRGKELDIEEINLLRESAKALRDNRAFQLIQDEALFVAHSYAVNGTKCFEDIYAAKMAVWWGLEENKNIKLLAGENPDLSS